MLKSPLITEKSMSLARTGWYTFMVAKEMTKQQIAALVSDKFKVEVVEVRTVNIPAKTKTQRTRKGYYQTKSVRKAIVRLKAGQSIAVFENVGSEEDVVVTTGENEAVTVKEKKNLLKGTKVKVEKMSKETVAKAEDAGSSEQKTTRQQAGKTKGEK
jgi:large subunit ribosomal protein L23